MIPIVLLILLVFISNSEFVEVSSISEMDRIVSENQNVMVMFNTNWCEVCQEIKPMLQKLSTKMRNVTLVSFDITDQQESELDKIHSDYDIQEFPTFYGFKNKMMLEFKKFKINRKAINEFINSITNLHYQIVSIDQLDKLVRNDPIVVSLTIDTSNQQHFEVQELYRELAHSMRKKVKFYLVDCKETIDPSLNIQNNPNQLNTSFEGQYSLQNLKQFIKTNMKQTIAEYDLTNPMDINEGQFTLLVLLENEEQNEQDIKGLYDTAELIKKQMPGELIIRYILKQNLPEDAVDSIYDRIESLSGLEREEVPRLLLLHDKDNQEILYQMDGEITTQNIMDQMEKAIDGTLERIEKSEPIPEQEDEFVHKLVYNTFKNFIDNTDKDLLIYFHAVWCEECAEFDEKYEKLAEDYNKVDSSLEFTKYDISENDIVYELENLPTLVYYNHKTQTYLNIEGELADQNIMKQIEQYSQENEDGQKEDL